MKSQGNYDGLDVPIEDGDYAIGIYEQGRWFAETSYFSKANELKGKYFNINTPIIFRPDGVHYFDLEIDVLEPLNRKRTIIDKELLDKAYQMNIVSEELYNTAIDVANGIKNNEVLIPSDSNSR
jgi:predicted RNA-binding protein associated with RNAse of E/G family